MARTFEDLTPEEQQRFEAQLALAGIDRAGVAGTVVIEGKQLVHADAARSVLKPHRLVVRDVAHMKQLGGIPDERFETESDDHIPYPKPLDPDRHRLLTGLHSRDAVEGSLTEHEGEAVHNAMRSYVLGNSARIAPDMVDLVNLLHFPIEASAFACENLELRSEFLIPGPEPKKLCFGTITMFPGGYIRCETECSITAAVITKVDQVGASLDGVDPTPDIDWQGSDGQRSDNGANQSGTGDPGDRGSPGKDNSKGTICETPAGEGKKGITGKPGGEGVDGGKGGNSKDGTVDFGEMAGRDYIFKLSGGLGGDGSDGGKGQKGGIGGPGGASTSKCGQGPGGPGGTGGPGGKAGTGGRGGNGGIASITYKKKQESTRFVPLKPVSAGGKAGKQGAGGDGGDGGTGSATGAQGGGGDIGAAGKPGEPGSPGTINITQI